MRPVLKKKDSLFHGDDCHYHVDERLLTIRDLIDRMDTSGVDKIAMIAGLCDPIPPPSPFLIGVLRFLLGHRRLRGLGKAMIERGHGHIVNTRSGAGVIGIPYHISYVVSKFAVHGHLKMIQDTLSDRGIKVR